MASREEVLAVIKRMGPLIPAVIGKELKMPLLIAQAHLSDLSSQKMVRVSAVKVGGSPLYFIPGQEEQLQKFDDRLSEKDKRVYDQLREEKVIRDKLADPLTRVSLRKALKDFAVELEVNTGEESEIFWRWYMASNDDVAPAIRSMVLGVSAQEVEEESLIEEEMKEEEKEVISPIGKEKAQTHPQEMEEKEDQVLEEEPQMQEDVVATTKQPPSSHVPQFIKVPGQQTLVEESNEEEKERTQSITRAKTEEKKEERKVTKQEIQPLTDDDFHNVLLVFFAENNISILTHNTIRKKSEMEFTLLVPTPLGELECYARAKNKKRINEGDLSVAYLEGQTQKLPVIFMTTGEIPKKLQPQLKTKYKGMLVNFLDPLE